MKDPGIECGFETLSTGVSVFSARAPDFSGFISLDECEALNQVFGNEFRVVRDEI